MNFVQRISFHPGETVVLNFMLPFSIYDVKAVVMSFRNRDRVAFEAIATSFKSEDTTDPETGRVIYKTRVGFSITQAESLQFDENYKYMMQLNVFGPNSSRIASNEIPVYTGAQQIWEPGFGGGAFYNYNDNYGKPSEEESDENAISYNDLVDRPKINSVTLEGNRILPEESLSVEQIDEVTTI